MRLRSCEHFGGELDSILYCINLCFAGAESLAWECGDRCFVADSAAGRRVVFVSVKTIKESVPSVHENHLSPPLAASASRPSSTTGVRSGNGGETALTKRDGIQPCAPAKSWSGYVPLPVRRWTPALADAVCCR